MTLGRGVVPRQALGRGIVSRQALGQGTVSRKALGRSTVYMQALGRGILSRHVNALGQDTVAKCYTLVRFDRAGQLRECAVRKCVDWGLRYESL